MIKRLVPMSGAFGIVLVSVSMLPVPASLQAAPGGQPGMLAAQEAAGKTKEPASDARKLSHDETLKWVSEHRAWRRARKTKPIWARAVLAAEIGMEFQTADHVAGRPGPATGCASASPGNRGFRTWIRSRASTSRQARRRRRSDSMLSPGDTVSSSPRPRPATGSRRSRGQGLQASSSGSEYESVAMTMHGVGYGLDEREPFTAQVAGLLDYLTAGGSSWEPKKILIVERDVNRSITTHKCIFYTNISHLKKQLTQYLSCLLTQTEFPPRV